MKEKEFLVATPADFTSVIAHILQRVAAPRSGATIIALRGDLGAGKTTFTQALGAHLGITEPITSPTFVVMKEYDIEHKHFDQLVHIDAYRIEDVSEAGPLHLQELFEQSRTLICLEWPEKIAEILPSDRVEVIIEIGEGEERIVTVR